MGASIGLEAGISMSLAHTKLIPNLQAVPPYLVGILNCLGVARYLDQYYG